MSVLAPIEVVVAPPPSGHALAGALRAMIERVARRPGVRVVDAAAGSGAGAGTAPSDTRAAARDPNATRFAVGLEVQAEACTLALGLEVVERTAGAAPAPAWRVPDVAFGVHLDGLERVQRLGSALAACIDVASSEAGRERLRTDAIFAGAEVVHVLAGSAHLSAAALHEAQARTLAARAAALALTALDEGRTWQVEDWAWPPELDVAAVEVALASGDVPELVRAQALARAEALMREVHDAVDTSLAAHGLSAILPLQAALARAAECARTSHTVASAISMGVEGTPSDAAVRTREAALADVPAPLPGATWLALGWAAPAGLLSGAALGPAFDDHALVALAGAGLFAGAVALANVAAVVRRRLAEAALARARRDYDEACAERAEVERRAVAPTLVRGAALWLERELGRERRTLALLEAHVRGLARTGDAALPQAPTGAHDPASVDVAVDLSAARRLLDPAPEPLVQRMRAELAGDALARSSSAPWRTSLPTLVDLLGAARELGRASSVAPTAPTAPWVARSDLARALTAPLAHALSEVDAALARLVPRGRQARRLAFVPAPFDASALDLRVESTVPSAGDAHLLVLWTPEAAS